MWIAGLCHEDPCSGVREHPAGRMGNEPDCREIPLLYLLFQNIHPCASQFFRFSLWCSA